MGQSTPLSGGAFILDGPIEFEVRNGLFYGKSTSNGVEMVFVQTPHAILASDRNFHAAYAKWERQRAKAEALPKH